MFTRPYTCLLACAVLGGMVGCASPHVRTDTEYLVPAPSDHHEKKSDGGETRDMESPPRVQEKKSSGEARDMESPPRVHMTKEEVVAKYGEPSRRVYSEAGEQWVYPLNDHPASLRDLNPFDPSGRTVIRYGVILFNSRGHVKRFRWDAGSAHERD